MDKDDDNDDMAKMAALQSMGKHIGMDMSSDEDPEEDHSPDLWDDSQDPKKKKKGGGMGGMGKMMGGGQGGGGMDMGSIMSMVGGAGG